MTQTSFLQKINTWLNPTLILIIGYFLKTNMDRIERKMDEIVQLRIESASVTAQLNALDYRVGRLEQSHTSNSPIKSTVFALAKPEEEYHVANYIKQ